MLFPTEEKQVEVTTAHLNKGRAVEEHSLVALIVVFLRHLSPPVTVLLPKFGVPESWLEWFFLALLVEVSKKEGQPDLLDFKNPIIRENASSVTLVPVLPKVENKFKIKDMKDLSVIF